MSPVRTLLLAAIRGYKRHLSPRKGYSCPCRVHLGRASCSTLGLRAIARLGAWRGLGALRLRLRECRRVREAFCPRPVRPRQAQAGFIDCDVPCDPSGCMPCDGSDLFSWLDCGGCDCGDYRDGGGSGGGSSDGWKRRRRRGS